MSFSSLVTFSVPPPNHPSILCPIISCRVSDILGTFVPTTLYQILGLEQQHGHQIIFIKKKNERKSLNLQYLFKKFYYSMLQNVHCVSLYFNEII